MDSAWAVGKGLYMYLLKFMAEYVNMGDVPSCPLLSVPDDVNNKYKIVEGLFMEYFSEMCIL